MLDSNLIGPSFEPRERVFYFWACLDCDWEDDDYKAEPHRLAFVEECPCCKSANIQMSHDYFQV